MLREHEMASAVLDGGRRLLQEIYEAQLQISRLTAKAVGVRNSVLFISCLLKKVPLQKVFYTII